MERRPKPFGTAAGSVYVVDASFAEVQTFYLQPAGNPTEETDPGRTMRFVYDSVPTDHGGIGHRAVRISYGGNTNNACDKVFVPLSSNQRRGFLTQMEMEVGIEHLVNRQTTAAQVDSRLECLDEIEAVALVDEGGVGILPELVQIKVFWTWA